MQYLFSCTILSEKSTFSHAFLVIALNKRKEGVEIGVVAVLVQRAGSAVVPGTLADTTLSAGYIAACSGG
ncbi:hypothetical protein RJ53_09940 [Methanocalculus chunghsingensis]|uniref:Uncharacterized protein n=1 Tax=Methanocalculus chunghsingensis TaxID=156457 RepID=A0A8J8B5G6_9EURY|nr:hypothetical protein [Methanocalculus chunghsingensis]